MATKGTIVLTGANGGIGSAIVSRLRSSAELSAYHAIYIVREASSTVVRQFQPSSSATTTTPTPQPYDVVSLDLSNLQSIRTVAAAINSRVAKGEIPPIRALILNAAYHDMGTQSFTDDGFATMFMVNYLGHWLLTLLLLQSMDREAGRIVVLGSKAHDPSEEQNAIAFKDEKWKTFLADDSTDPIAKGTWSSNKDDPTFKSGMRRYGATKLCAIMMIGELQRRLSDDPLLSNVCILGVDPGTVPSTGITRRGPLFIRIVVNYIYPLISAYQRWRNPNANTDIRPAEKSAADILAAAFDCSPTLGEHPKGLYLDGSELADVSAEAKDEGKRLMVWRDSVRYTGLKGEETLLQNWS